MDDTYSPKSRDEISSRAIPGRAITKAESLHDGDQSRRAITIRRSPAEVYAFWRDFRNFPLFMKDVAEVRIDSPTRSHWTVKLSHGLAKGLARVNADWTTAEWDAEIIHDSPGKMISWRSLEGSEVETAGSVWISPAPQDRGSIVKLSMIYSVPGGRMAELLTLLTGEDPDSLAQINLRRAKAYLETGEIPTIQGQSSGRDESSYAIGTH